RSVKERKEWMPLEALRHQVNTAVPGIVAILERVVLCPGPLLGCRERMGSRPAQVELATGKHQGVADGLGVEPAAVKPPIETVRRILPGIDLIIGARKLIRL